MTKQEKINRTLTHLARLFGSPRRVNEIMMADFLRSSLAGEVDYEILDSTTTLSGLCDLWLLYRGSQEVRAGNFAREIEPKNRQVEHSVCNGV